MIVEKEKINMKKGNGIALLPIGVFLVLYLGLGILFEYVLKIPMGFYNVPIVVAFLAAILVACVQNRKVNFDKKLELMAQGVGDKNIIILNQPSEPATEADRKTGLDLLDTLKAHEEECVGMAANMIGVRKNIIAVHMGFMNVLMYNPKIIKRSGAYETEEGCLSLAGVRKCMRYQEIEVQYQDINFKQQRQMYSGWIAQIIQHEIDHCCGILI